MQSRTSSRFALAVLLGSLSTAFACKATPAPKPGEVMREWNTTLRELGINPVYPPREDLQVGDVYVRRGYVADDKLAPSKGFAPIDLWLATADTGGALGEFYAARSSFPMTPEAEPKPAAAPADGGAVVTPAVMAPPPAQPPSAIFGQGDTSRLRVVAFPDFTSLNIRATDLRAFVPIEALGLGVGGNWSGQHQVNVKIPVAESCGLPLNAALPLIADTGAAGWKLKHEIADPALLAKLHEDIKAWAAVASHLSSEDRTKIADDKFLHLDLITEVFYTRAINVAVSSQSAKGTGVSVKPAVSVPGAASTSEAAALLPGEGNALERAAALNDELSKIDSMNVPGGSVQFLSASDGALSMRRRFDRPVAIGYRAVQISVDPADGLIVGLGAAANRVAQVTAGDESTTAQALCDEITKQLTAAGAGTFIIRATTGDTLVFDCRAQGATNLTAATLDERIKAMAPQIAQAVRSADSTLNDAQKALLERFESKAFSVVLDAE